jgi:hypothetical protein
VGGQAPALRRQQRLAERLFEQAELGADGLHRHTEPGGGRDAAFLGYHSKAIEVTEIQGCRFNISVFSK